MENVIYSERYIRRLFFNFEFQPSGGPSKVSIKKNDWKELEVKMKENQ